ncbi:hypothetical protein PR048_013771 [Dryococelus australis]|uniref:Uncharacterized protein n=1 Tax=Dryococelus australis TaxID=614101 RepID=A0ABQ9HTE3_9NEOP|nr:hypothetical protein PR048_013771 [Dryococelus australis]
MPRGCYTRVCPILSVAAPWGWLKELSRKVTAAVSPSSATSSPLQYKTQPDTEWHTPNMKHTASERKQKQLSVSVSTENVIDSQDTLNMAVNHQKKETKTHLPVTSITHDTIVHTCGDGERQTKVVIKGLPHYADTEHIKDKLKDYSFSAIHIWKFHTLADTPAVFGANHTNTALKMWCSACNIVHWATLRNTAHFDQSVLCVQDCTQSTDCVLKDQEKHSWENAADEGMCDGYEVEREIAAEGKVSDKTLKLYYMELLCVRLNSLYMWAVVAERLACSPPTKAIRVQSPAGSLRIFACGYRAGRCRWSAGFLGDLPFPLPFYSGVTPYSPQSPSSALETLIPTSIQSMPCESTMFYTSSSTLTHTRLQSPGFTPSHPFTLRTLVPPPSHTDKMASAKDCWPLDCGSIYSVIGSHREFSLTRTLHRESLFPRISVRFLQVSASSAGGRGCPVTPASLTRIFLHHYYICRHLKQGREGTVMSASLATVRHSQTSQKTGRGGGQQARHSGERGGSRLEVQLDESISNSLEQTKSQIAAIKIELDAVKQSVECASKRLQKNAPERHFSEMFECTRHLNAPIEDKEFAEVIVSQLPSRYQDQWEDRPFTNIPEFCCQILKIDQSERQRSIFNRNVERPAPQCTPSLYQHPRNQHTPGHPNFPGNSPKVNVPQFQQEDGLEDQMFHQERPVQKSKFFHCLNKRKGKRFSPGYRRNRNPNNSQHKGNKDTSPKPNAHVHSNGVLLFCLTRVIILCLHSDKIAQFRQKESIKGIVFSDGQQLHQFLYKILTRDLNLFRNGRKLILYFSEAEKYLKLMLDWNIVTRRSQSILKFYGVCKEERWNCLAVSRGFIVFLYLIPPTETELLAFSNIANYCFTYSIHKQKSFDGGTIFKFITPTFCSIIGTTQLCLADIFTLNVHKGNRLVTDYTTWLGTVSEQHVSGSSHYISAVFIALYYQLL